MPDTTPSLHRKPTAPDAAGFIQRVTPQNAGWQYVGFEAAQLKSGAKLAVASDNSTELCVVILSGIVSFDCGGQQTGGEQFLQVGQRMSVFDGTAPYALYVPPGLALDIFADTDAEIALCRAFVTERASGKQYPLRLIKPEDCTRETRGQGTNTRLVCNILLGNLPAERLLITEVITPPGHWSSYPPHKHDADMLPVESALEETYYHKLNPQQGFAFQRVYTDDRSLDETICVEHNSLVLVPRGYHPVGAPHGYELYYLNVMAGPTRQWVFKNDPQHEWIIKK